MSHKVFDMFVADVRPPDHTGFARVSIWGCRGICVCARMCQCLVSRYIRLGAGGALQWTFKRCWDCFTHQTETGSRKRTFVHVLVCLPSPQRQLFLQLLKCSKSTGGTRGREMSWWAVVLICSLYHFNARLKIWFIYYRSVNGGAIGSLVIPLNLSKGSSVEIIYWTSAWNFPN